MSILNANNHTVAEFAECPACGDLSVPVPKGFGILFRTARCDHCGETFGKWCNFVDEEFEITLRKGASN